jgi:hypothetical protein
MATITLTADTDVSALSLANDDTIDLAGFVLTFGVQPTVTGIQVVTPGTNGRCTFPVACVIPTWDFFGGSNTAAGMIGTLPANCEIGSITGGTITNSFGINTNNGTVGTATGGSAAGAFAIGTNNHIVGIANGGTANNVRGITTNNGIIGTANGSAFGGAVGLGANFGTVGTANGGTGGSAHGVNDNNATVGTANGGGAANSYGIATNNATCLKASNNTGLAILTSRGDFKLVIGPEFQTTINNPAGDITTIYSIGPLSELATIPAVAEVITLSEGTGTAGFTGIRGVSRRLGT